MGHPFQKEVLKAQSLARSAGETAKALKTGSRFSLKKNGDGPVSEADLKADEIIREGLRGAFPSDLLISEETANLETIIPDTGRTWLIDPIDGTADFVIGGIDYSIMIGLLVDRTPTVGVIYGPETGEMWTGVIWTENGDEKFFAERTERDGASVYLDLTKAPRSSGPPIITVSKHHPSRVTDKIVETLRPSQIITKGSLGLKIALIADGKADFYAAASRRIKAWDTCAPFALLKAARGSVYTFDGHEVIFGPTCTHTSPFFASSYRFAPAALQALSQNLGYYASS